MARTAESLIGRTLGTWRVVSYAGTRDDKGKRKSLWKCECVHCGNSVDIARSVLIISGRDKSSVECSGGTLGLGRVPVCGICTERASDVFIGREYGQLLIAEVLTGSADKSTWRVRCICTCGNEVTRGFNAVIYGSVTVCHECALTAIGQSPRKDAIAIYMQQVLYGAKTRCLETTCITRDYLLSLFGGTCALSGVPISLGGIGRKGHITRTASLDRIDSLKGYIYGNVQWVHKSVNLMKQDMDESEFKDFCKKIAAACK